MKHVVEAGTDVASLCYFDSEALPEDFDERIKAAAMEEFDASVREGRLVWIQYNSDGGYLLHFYVNEPVPDEVLRYALDPVKTPRLHVPSGKLWVCGAEYACRDPATGRLARHPHMGGCFSLPAGDYAAATWPVEWPVDATEQAIERALGTDAMQSRARTARLLRGSIVMALVLTLALGISMFRTLSAHTSFPMWSPYVSALIASLVVAIVALLRSSRRFDREHRVDEIARNFPSFVVFLERLSV